MPSEHRWWVSAWMPVSLLGLALLVHLFNRQVFFLINGFQAPYLDWIMLSLTNLGNGVSAAMLVLLLAPFRRDLTLRTAVAMVTAGLLTRLIKELVTAPRPPAVLGDLVHVLGPKLMGGSFPSGHAATVFALAFSLKGYVDVRIYRGVLILAAFVSLSRVYTGAHFPVDVVLGALLGWISAVATRPLADRLSGYLDGPRPVLEYTFLLIAAACGAYLAFFEVMARYNPWFLKPFGLIGAAAAVFMLAKVRIERRRQA